MSRAPLGADIPNLRTRSTQPDDEQGAEQERTLAVRVLESKAFVASLLATTAALAAIATNAVVSTGGGAWDEFVQLFSSSKLVHVTSIDFCALRSVQHMHTHVHTAICTCKHVNTCTSTHTYAHIHMNMHVYAHIHMNMHAYAHVHTHACTCTYMFTHT